MARAFGQSLLTLLSESHGTIQGYDKVFDRINTRNEKPLEILDRVRYNASTSDDPIIAQVSRYSTPLDPLNRHSSPRRKKPTSLQPTPSSRFSCVHLAPSIPGISFSTAEATSSSSTSEKAVHSITSQSTRMLQTHQLTPTTLETSTQRLRSPSKPPTSTKTFPLK